MMKKSKMNKMNKINKANNDTFEYVYYILIVTYNMNIKMECFHYLQLPYIIFDYLVSNKIVDQIFWCTASAFQMANMFHNEFISKYLLMTIFEAIKMEN